MVDVPELPACEIAHGTPAARVPCSRGPRSRTILLSLSGAVTAQVDSLGSGTQGYTVTLSP